MDSTQENNQQRSGPNLGSDMASPQLPPYPPAPPEALSRHRSERGARQKGLPYKSPALAAFLSLMPGLGQIYVGYYQRGFVNMGIVALVITILATSAVLGLDVFLGLFLAFFWLYNIIDANRKAVLYNQALDGVAGIELPEDFELPEKGSMSGGIVLIVIGLILFFHTKFDMSLDWLEEWWPLAAVGFGIYLIVKGRQNKSLQSTGD